MVSIPGRKIDAKLQSVLATCVRDLLHDITSTVAPGAVLNRMLGVFRRPEAESVVMFASQNQAFHARRRCSPDDLIRIEIRRIED